MEGERAGEGRKQSLVEKHRDRDQRERRWEERPAREGRRHRKRQMIVFKSSHIFHWDAGPLAGDWTQSSVSLA